MTNTILPYPQTDTHFSGTIGRTYTDSEPVVAEVPKAPEGAPNVLLILLDDVGFGHTSTFGGPVNTPTLEKLSKEGIRYNRFHTTALCSPTRAAILSGRNHHSVHTGIIMELSTGFPGYDGRWPENAVCVAETMRRNNYNTAAFGKWHNTPDFETSPAGPFDRWPTGHGFEYFWGFQGGETNQWDPPLFENTSPTQRPEGSENWHLSEAMADQAIGWISQQKASAPDKPFFCYWAPGAAHAPHHVGKEWSDKYKGKFDQGWDKVREETLERQIKLGVVPKGTKLTPRPESMPAWDECSADEKKLYARMQEVFAGFLEHVDAQIGRVVEALETMNLRDDTLIIYVVGDNGPSAEGSLTGTVNNMKSQHGYPDSVEEMLKMIDEIGTGKHENHYPVPWCWAGSSPFQWCKQVASHFGGTRNPVVMSWPARIKDTGSLRNQFHHAIDIVPTILEAAGIAEPVSVNGIPQKPIEGVSMAYTWDDAKAASARKTQYFEMLGNRALYHDGWVAGARHGKLPWQTAGSNPDFDADVWELYNIEDDFSQAVDLAEKEPQRLRQLQDLFWAEAAKYNVLPLDDRFVERADVNLKPNYLRGKTQFVYLPVTTRIPEPSSPPTKNVNHTIAVECEVPEGGGEGVLVCCGGEAGGYSLFMKDGKLFWEHNWFDTERYRVESKNKIPAGHCVLSVHVECDKEGEFATGGTASLRVGEDVVGEGKFDKQVGARFTVGESFDVGCDLITPVSELYESPAAFNGKIARVMVDVSDTSVDDLAHQVRIAMATQ
ncbi:sulfatase-like hydrolase/transferase [Altererythrobacter salegens]|uniref:Sulfatase-like hydrolase/transferase n=1 Tax=Croceibacterium salegens TaxID=1737568 RepID=A0A6I4T0E2_9SPHN|nr:arylsulfatase [Croceibacterium salegens]MXO60686.1 sulfatase-like hydrolase/transferase [Croceibacterium salegens]